MEHLQHLTQSQTSRTLACAQQHDQRVHLDSTNTVLGLACQQRLTTVLSRLVCPCTDMLVIVFFSIPSKYISISLRRLAFTRSRPWFLRIKARPDIQQCLSK